MSGINDDKNINDNDGLNEDEKQSIDSVEDTKDEKLSNDSVEDANHDNDDDNDSNDDSNDSDDNDKESSKDEKDENKGANRWKEFSRKNERRVKELVSQLDELNEKYKNVLSAAENHDVETNSLKSQLEEAKQLIASLQADTTKLNSQLIRTQVVEEFGLDRKLIDYLKGETLEELKDSAKELQGVLQEKPKTRTASFVQGNESFRAPTYKDGINALLNK